MEAQAKYEVAVQPRAEIINLEDYAMSVDGLVKQVQLIQQVMDKVMVDNEHYGKIPGTKKPTLLKPGAEKLCLTFRLDPRYEIIREVREKDWIAYTVQCSLFHILSGQQIASGIGSCNSRETKYRYRYIEESTGLPLPKAYWQAKEKGDSKEMKRILGGEEYRAAKIDGAWVIAKSQKIENDNPWDLDNTIIKMACKRALVAATLNATAASDIFTQDLEEMLPETTQPEAKPEVQMPPQGQQQKTTAKPPEQPKSLFETLMTARGNFCNLIMSNKDKILDFLPDEMKAIKDRWNKASAAGAGGVAKGAPWPLDKPQVETSPAPSVVDFGENDGDPGPQEEEADPFVAKAEAMLAELTDSNKTLILKLYSMKPGTAHEVREQLGKLLIGYRDAFLSKASKAIDSQNATK